MSASGKLLVLSVSRNVYQLKLEAVLAAGLMHRGWETTVFTSARTNGIAHRLFRAVGVTRFVYLDDLEVRADKKSAFESEAAHFLKSPLTLQSVKAWTYRNAWIGPQILSSVARENHLGSPDPTKPAVQAQIKKVLPEVLKRVAQAEQLLVEERPTMALANESNSAMFGPFADVLIAAGVNVIAMQQPWRDDALVFKRLNAQTRRIHPASVTLDTLDRFAREPWSEPNAQELQRIFEERYGGRWALQSRNQPDTVSYGRAELLNHLQLDESRPTGVVFSHVLWDANLFYGDDLFEDYGEWFVETVRAACANSAVNWLVKLHPANIWKRKRDGEAGELAEMGLVREHIGILPPHVKLLEPSTEVSTLSLFSIADFGVTVRGTTGIELPCFGVPTFTAGTGRYSGLGFTLDSASREEYLSRLRNLPAGTSMTEEMVHRARWHALLVLERRQWPMKSFRPVMTGDFTGQDPLEQNLEIAARSNAEIEKNGDLRKWADWAESREIDYLDAS